MVSDQILHLHEAADQTDFRPVTRDDDITLQWLKKMRVTAEPRFI